ncbi:hypothetical protein AB0J90_01260 [Micromonospora sp. NPDC049523]|uniref:hypothetical protein n=1 Tax=Micromonospora sp. NPDC049523 TaxID=3155921 RepID=UPI0034422C34
MDTGAGQPVQWWWKKPHVCLARWELRDAPPLNAGQISVGKFDGGDWWVDHGGFGCRRFPDKNTAWTAVRRLMGLHDGNWVQVPGDSERRSPLRFDGSRTLYSDGGGDMYSHWGRAKEKRWNRYSAAIAAGTRLRHSEEHPAMGGYVTLSEYRDPYDDSIRFVVDDQCDGIPDVNDYPYRNKADRAYVSAVWSHASRRFPYVSTDVPKVPADSRPEPVRYGEGGSVILDDSQARSYERSWRENYSS